MIRVALAQIHPAKADYAENLRRVGGVLSTVRSWEPSPDLVVFPESVMSGYFLEGGVREAAVPAGALFKDLQAQHSASHAPPLDVVVGFYEEFRSRYYNSALYATLGGPGSQIRHIHRKVFLPTYGVFDEGRFVRSGDSIRAFDTAWGRAAILICEDSWHSLTSTLAALDGAQVLIVPSAAPARGIEPEAGRDRELPSRPTSVSRWERLIQRLAEEHGVYVILTQLVGFEGGKGFQGGSLVVGPDGNTVVAGPVFEEALIQAELDPEAITRARVEQPHLADLEVQLLNLLRLHDGTAATTAQYDDGKTDSRSVERVAAAEIPIVVRDERDDPMAMDCELTAQWLTAFLKDEVVRRRGFSRGLVGMSGGVDSSLTTLLASRALGSEQVIGVRMPYRSSSAESLDHAELLAKQLGIRMVTVDISAAVDGYLKAVGDDTTPARRGNVMARLRMVTLFDLSAKYQALPIGTGNKTERLLGYFTWHADDSPPVNPLGDLFKTQVWELARHVGVPKEILSKPATADLVAGQTDEGDLGISYARADLILYWLLKGLRREQIAALGCASEEIDLVSSLLRGTHWKRRLPTVAMVSGTAIGQSYLRPVDY
jgi:NAD+ synthetase